MHKFHDARRGAKCACACACACAVRSLGCGSPHQVQARARRRHHRPLPWAPVFSRETRAYVADWPHAQRRHDQRRLPHGLLEVFRHLPVIALVALAAEGIITYALMIVNTRAHVFVCMKIRVLIVSITT